MNRGLELFKQRLSGKFQDGSRRLVPIIGSGLHHHLRAHGVPDFDVCDLSGLANWSDLLVAASLDDTGRPEFRIDLMTDDDDPTAVWEGMVTARARVYDSPANEHERLMQRRVEKAIAEATPGVEALETFGAALSRRQFRDVVTLNFDRTLDRAMRRAAVEPKVYGSKVVRSDAQGTEGAAPLRRIWHPHGVVGEVDAVSRRKDRQYSHRDIQLGLRHYAKSASQVLTDAHAFRTRKREWKEQEHKPMPFWDHMREQPKSWVDVLLNSDIVFIGCGLNRAELDLWLLLHERQRELARVQENERPLAFFLHPYEGFPRHICKKSAGLLPVITRDHDECWELLLGRWWS